MSMSDGKAAPDINCVVFNQTLESLPILSSVTTVMELVMTLATARV